MAVFRTSFFLAAVFFLLPQVQAATVIRPEPALATDISALVTSVQQQSDGIIEGDGNLLHMLYTSSVQIHAFMAPFRTEEAYNPKDMVRFVLPAHAQGDVLIDLAASPAWSSGSHRYFLAFFSTSTESDTAFHTMEFGYSDGPVLLGAAAAHFVQPEQLRFSSYHLLSGWRVLGMPVALIAGLLTLLVAAATWLASGKTVRARRAVSVLLWAILLYQARFALDLTRATARNLSSWSRTGVYSDEGSVTLVADAVREAMAIRSTPSLLSVCHDTTNLYAKALRYFLAPLPVALHDDPKATHVLVYQKFLWSFENGILTCGGIKAPAKELQKFPDGSILYSLER